MIFRRLLAAIMGASLLLSPAYAADRKPIVLGASGQQQQIQSGDTLAVPNAKVTSISGSTQCVQASSAGLLSGTGATCGGGAGCTFANPTATAADTAVNGTATTCMRSDAAPAVQKATSSVFGIVEVDGTTLVSTGGVISATGSVAAGTPATIKDLWFWYEPTNMLASSGTSVQVLQNLTPWYTGLPAPLSTGGGATGATMDAATLNGNSVINTAGSIAARYTIAVAPGGNSLLTNSTTFVVFKPNALAAATSYAFISGAASSFEFRIVGGGGTGNLEVLKTNIASIGTSTAAGLTSGTWYQANVTYASGTGAYAFRVGRAVAGSGTNVQAITVVDDSFFWNKAGGSDDLNAKIAAIIVYSRVLTGGEITTIETYLFNKYGV